MLCGAGVAGNGGETEFGKCVISKERREYKDKRKIMAIWKCV